MGGKIQRTLFFWKISEFHQNHLETIEVPLDLVVLDLAALIKANSTQYSAHPPPSSLTHTHKLLRRRISWWYEIAKLGGVKPGF
jgi:hypothetical protein